MNECPAWEQSKNLSNRENFIPVSAPSEYFWEKNLLKKLSILSVLLFAEYFLFLESILTT